MTQDRLKNIENICEIVEFKTLVEGECEFFKN